VKKPTLSQRRKALAKRWSEIVRSRPGPCEMQGLYIACNGPFQGAHGFNKKSYPAVRYLITNGFKICQAHHFWSHRHEIQWDMFMREKLGKYYEALRALALENAPFDAEKCERSIGLHNQFFGAK
jgi:hypothetical protein